MCLDVLLRVTVIWATTSQRAAALAFFYRGELSIGIAIGGEGGETFIAERAPHGQRHCAHLRSAHAPRRSHDFSKTAAKRFVIDAIALYAIVAV